MATIRIFLLTYRRPVLLRRALSSLLKQTFSDWVCELHNDAPDDRQPEQIASEFNDPRIRYVHHNQNLGPVASFNVAFRGGPEPFASILEDDNWWEPDFLSACLAELERHPDCNLVWSNMRIWTETDNGEWKDTAKTIWPIDGSSVAIHRWPQLLQIFDAIHSNGAMIYRASAKKLVTVPAETPFSIIEPVRERGLTGNLLLVRSPLANYAQTRHTARGDDRVVWTQSQLLLGASFFQSVPITSDGCKRIWDHRRSLYPRSTDILFLLALCGCAPKNFLSHASFRDWVHVVANVARHPLNTIKTLGFRSQFPMLWSFLTTQSLLRTKEAKVFGFETLGSASLAVKSECVT